MKSIFVTIILVIALVAVNIFSLNAQTPEQLYQKGLIKEEGEGALQDAINFYNQIADNSNADKSLQAKALLHVGLCYEKLGNKEAVKAYQRLVSTCPDQTEMVTLAKARLAALGTGSAARSTEVAMRRIWVAGKDLPICISPDGQYVVFRIYDSGNLWLRDLQSGEQRQITREGSRVESTLASTYAAISPDGKWIAYSWWNKSYGELRLSLLDGSSMRILHSGRDGKSMDPRAWMPDGRQILAVSQGNGLAYLRHIISLSDGSVRDIGQPEPGIMNWGYPSPDGRHVAYSLNGDIFVYDIATEQDMVLVKNPAADNMVG
jgi:hypothetical protein